MFRAEKVPGAKVVTFANAAETFLEFQNGGVDAVIQDFPVGLTTLPKAAIKAVWSDRRWKPKNTVLP